jgi:uncharacterized membrane protein
LKKTPIDESAAAVGIGEGSFSLEIEYVCEERFIMAELFSVELSRIHPMLVAFPLALLVVSVLLDWVARWRPSLLSSARLTLFLGTLGALVATITGIIAHLPYERTAVIGFIDQHEQFAMITTLLFLALSIWRALMLRRGKDVGGTWLYAALSLVGLVALVVTGGLGGNLVFGHGVAVSH